MSEPFIKINFGRVWLYISRQTRGGGSLGTWFDSVFTIITVFMKDWDTGLSLPIRCSLSPPCYFLDLLVDSNFEIPFTFPGNQNVIYYKEF